MAPGDTCPGVPTLSEVQTVLSTVWRFWRFTRSGPYENLTWPRQIHSVLPRTVAEKEGEFHPLLWPSRVAVCWFEERRCPSKRERTDSPRLRVMEYALLWDLFSGPRTASGTGVIFWGFPPLS